MSRAPRHLARAVLILVLFVSTRNADASGYSVDTWDRGAVVAFYHSVYRAQDALDPAWTGNVASCTAGDVTADYRAAAVRRVNFFRAMAGLPADIQLRDDWNAKCQEGALMLNANQQLSHSPPPTWKCYTSAGAEALSRSDIAYGYATAWDAVTAWMADPGIWTAGHRRWVLHPPAAQMGFGCTFGGSYRSYALWVIGGAGTRPPTPEWVAWPPAGYVPYTLVPNQWSFSYPGADLHSATVSLTREGTPVATNLQTVSDDYGDNTLVWAVSEFPSGIPPRDTRYQVTVDGVRIAGNPRSFTYETVVFDPDQVVAVDASSPGGTVRLGAEPNPFSESVRLQYELASDADVRVAVYDAAGRMVRVLFRGHREPGGYQLLWDGRDHSGALVAAGSYLCRLQVGERVSATRILRVGGSGTN